MDINKRFQEQKWYVKLWRYRHYIKVPIVAFNIWRRGNDKNHAWDIAMGLASIDIQLWWTSDEVKEMFKRGGKSENTTRLC